MSRARGRTYMSTRTLPGPAAGGPVRVLASAAIGAALIVTLGAAAAPAAGAQARAGTVTNFKFALNAVSLLSSSDASAVGDRSTGAALARHQLGTGHDPRAARRRLPVRGGCPVPVRCLGGWLFVGRDALGHTDCALERHRLETRTGPGFVQHLERDSRA